MQRPTEIHVAYMGNFDGGRRRQGVWQGQAAVLTPPHIPSYPQPQVTWFHEGQKISPSARIAVTMENQLVVLATAAADAGRYRVQAVNERNGENKTSQELELDVEDASSPADPVAPEIVVAPRNMSVRFGTEGATLECVANARPIDLLTLEWWRGSRKVMEGVSSWGRRLSLPTLTSVHGGSYECRALLRGSRVPSASAFAHLTITEQPVFIQEPEGHTVGEVESVVELPCKAIGVPPPKFTWFKDGDRLLIQRDPRVSLTPNGGLRIRALEPGDTGIFQCWAQNMAGMTQSYTHLSVTSVAASIMRGPADAVVIARTIVELPCEAHGAPRPSVAWERDGVVLVSGSMQTPRYILLETGGLRIDPALRSDSGTFTCIVANSQGQDQATATLTVWGEKSTELLESIN
uniref:Ig-like domain-containing protein n=1 Tax=Eptatretus burgeri TaxID=7764 RepID=A0A8C4R080_EPTBU